jgi:hypothetical protein
MKTILVYHKAMVENIDTTIKKLQCLKDDICFLKKHSLFIERNKLCFSKDYSKAIRLIISQDPIVSVIDKFTIENKERF